jgi:hypothetical protein
LISFRLLQFALGLALRLAMLRRALRHNINGLLNSDPRTALAMFASLENRAAQLRLIAAAVKSRMPPDYGDVFTCVMSASVRPAMKERDKLAHWCWAFTPELPDDLLLITPDSRMARQYRAWYRDEDTPIRDPGMAGVYVVTEKYLEGLFGRIRKAEFHLMELAGIATPKHTEQARAEHFQQLSNEPLIREALARLHEGRQKNQAAQPQSPPPEPSETE